MNKIILLFGAAIVAQGVLGDSALTLKFGRGSDIGVSYFYSLPITRTSAVEDYGWIEYDRPTSHRKGLDMFCSPYDVSACCLYDSVGNLGGLQIGIEKVKYSYEVLDWVTQGYTEWSVDVNGETREYWVMTQFYMSDSYLALDADERDKSYDTSTLFQEGKFWATAFYGELFEMPITSTELLESGFTEHNCIAGMGTHYYRNMTTELICASDKLYPWAPMTVSGNVVGCVLNNVGQIAVVEGEPDYFEHPALPSIQAILKTAPDCLLSAATDPGLTTMHVYYYADPHLISCS